jgi:hypothetical protein
MKARKYFLGGLICCICFSPMGGIAQESCTQKLRTARNAYQEGKLNVLPALLTACIKAGFSKEEKIEALRLVTLAYLYSENERKAEQVFLDLLTIDPEFTPNLQADPTELILLAEKFDTDPKFFYGLNGGVGYNITQVSEARANIVDLASGKYQFTTTYGIGGFFSYPITNEWSATLEAHMMWRTTELIRVPVQNAESANSQTIRESQSWIEVPVLANYRLPIMSMNLEFTAGPVVHYLLKANVSSESSGDTFQNVDYMDSRSQYNLSGIFGIRSNFKVVGRNYLTVALLYQHRLFNEVASSTEKTEKQTTFELGSGYGDGRYKNHAVWLKVGLRFPYFKPQLK